MPEIFSKQLLYKKSSSSGGIVTGKFVRKVKCNIDPYDSDKDRFFWCFSEDCLTWYRNEISEQTYEAALYPFSNTSKPNLFGCKDNIYLLKDTDKIYRSTNGCKNWEDVTAYCGFDVTNNTTYLSQAGDKFFLAHPTRDVIATQAFKYSYDGLNWTDITLPTAFGYSAGKVVYANGRYFVGVQGASSGNGRIAYSNNGINWVLNEQRRTVMSPMQAYYSNNRIIIVSGAAGGENVVYSDDNGMNWTYSTFESDYKPGTNPFSFFENNMLIVERGSNNALKSTDYGSSFSKIILPMSYYAGTSFLFADNKFVWIAANSTASGGNAIYTSNDFENWTYQKNFIQDVFSDIPIPTGSFFCSNVVYIP